MDSKEVARITGVHQDTLKGHAKSFAKALSPRLAALPFVPANAPVHEVACHVSLLLKLHKLELRAMGQPPPANVMHQHDIADVGRHGGGARHLDPDGGLQCVDRGHHKPDSDSLCLEEDDKPLCSEDDE